MTVQTNHVWGRELADDEVNKILTQIEVYKTAGVTDGVISYSPDGLTRIRSWADSAAATAFLTFLNTQFSPAPTSATQV